MTTHSETVQETLWRIALERGLRRSTALSYERLFRSLGLLEVPTGDVTADTVQEALWTLVSPNTRRAAIIAVRSILGFQIKIPRSIPRRYEMPSEDTLRCALMTSPHEIRGLLMMYGGLRLAEACAITEADLKGDRLRVDKQVQVLHRTGHPTQIRIADVKSYNADIVIPSHLAQRLAGITDTVLPLDVRHSIRRAGNKVGIHLNPHQLRKWYITTLIERGCPLELVRRQARHSDISVTLTHYQQFNEQDIHKYF